MKYLKTQIKILIVVFIGLGMMALAGDPVEPEASSTVASSIYQDAN